MFQCPSCGSHDKIEWDDWPEQLPDTPPNVTEVLYLICENCGFSGRVFVGVIVKRRMWGKPYGPPIFGNQLLPPGVLDCEGRGLSDFENP